jgi:hypothetical protein
MKSGASDIKAPTKIGHIACELAANFVPASPDGLRDAPLSCAVHRVFGGR